MAGDYEALARYFDRPISLGPDSLDVAKFILLNANASKPLGPGILKGNKPSLMGRIFDILSRPNYAVAEFVRQGGNPAGILEGLTGKKKTTFSDVLAESGMGEGSLRSTLGLGLDIFADPTTYIGGAGLISKARTASKVGKSEKAAREVLANRPYAQTLLDRGEPIHPEVFGLPTREAGAVPEALRAIPVTKPSSLLRTNLDPAQKFNVPKPSESFPGQLELPLPGVPKGLPKNLDIRTPQTPPVGETIARSVGQIPIKFRGLNVKTAKAQDIVERVADGDLLSVARIMPPPKPSISTAHQRAADDILRVWDKSSPEQINRQFPETLNAKQQVSLYNKAIETAKTKYKKPGTISAHAYKIYLAMEKSLESQGLVPRLGTGENVKLSDVIQQLGGHQRASEVINDFRSGIKEGSSTGQAVEALRASGAIQDARSVKLIAEKVGEAKAASHVPDSLEKGFDKFLKNFGKSTARADGVSPAGVAAVDKLIDFTLKSGKTPAQLVTEQKSKILDDIISKSKANAEVTHAVTLALEKDLGQLPKWAVNDNKAVEFMMGRVATWWGQKDLRPLSLNAIGSSMATAATRGKVLDRIFAPYNNAQRHEAFKLAQGIGTPSSPEVLQLANQVTHLMDNLVAVERKSGVHLEMINKWMKWYKVGFTFFKGKSKNILGDEIDFSKESDWVNSWKVANITEDPKVFLFKMQQAMEQATREKALFDEIGERFGTRAYGKGYSNKIQGYPYLEGYYFTNDIAKQLPRVVKDWSIEVWHPKSKFIQHYDRVLSMWKSGVTIYRPAHHIRNMVGDIYLGWMDGVNFLKPYLLAAKVQRSMRGAYTNLSDVDRLVEIGALNRNYKTPEPNQVLFRNRSGIGFTAEQVAAVAHQKGLLEHARTLEDIIDLGESGKFKPFGGKVQAVARGASELQNHNARLAHFIDKVIKSHGSNLQNIFEQASRRARKWHPSGLDLTDFERKALRRVIPFYSWLRKSTPLLIEGLVMNPGKAVIPAKIHDALQDYQGIDTPGRHDPFPVDQMFPEWLRAQGIGPISAPDGLMGKLSNQDPPGYVMGGLGLNPLSDLVAQLETPGKSIATSLTPAVQVPTELLTGRKIFTQEPISGLEARPGAMQQYIGEQIPVYSALQGITGITPFGTETKRGSSQEALINFLTSAGIKGTGPYVKQARYEKLASGKMQRKIGREQLIEELRKRLEEG